MFGNERSKSIQSQRGNKQGKKCKIDQDLSNLFFILIVLCNPVIQELVIKREFGIDFLPHGRKIRQDGPDIISPDFYKDIHWWISEKLDHNGINLLVEGLVVEIL